MKRGLIRTFGDSKFGMGHVCRSLCVLNVLKTLGIEVRIILYPEEAKQLNDILDKNFVEVLEDNTRIGSAYDFLLYDMPFPDKNFTSAFKSSNPKATMLALDYSDSTDSNLDIIVNLYDHQRMLEGREKNTRTRFLSGFDYAIIREEFYAWRKKTLNFNPKIENVLITFGGADPSHNTEKVLQCEEIISRNVTVVIGPRFEFDKDAWQSSSQTGNKVNFIERTNRLPELMHSADIIFCGGGTTMLEAMFLGVPCLVVPQTKDEVVFSSYAEEKGGVISIKTSKISEIEKKFQTLECLNLRLQISEKARNLINGDGAKKIATLLLE